MGYARADWRGGYRRSERGMSVRDDIRPISAWAAQADGNQVVRERARWQGDVVEVDQTLAEYVQRDSVVADESAVDKSLIWRKLAGEGRLLPDRSDSLRIFDWLCKVTGFTCVGAEKCQVKPQLTWCKGAEAYGDFLGEQS